MASSEASFLGCAIAFYFSVVAFTLFLAAKMFEFSFWFVFGKDIPWYLDLLGGVVLNAVNLPLWVVTYISYSVGVQAPLIG